MDRIVAIEFENVRVFERFQLDLAPLTVLVGENGTGKSTVVELLRFLSTVPEQASLHDRFTKEHRGAGSLVRSGAKGLRIRVSLDGIGGALAWTLGLQARAPGQVAVGEEALVAPGGAVWLARRSDGSGASARRGDSGEEIRFGGGDSSIGLGVAARSIDANEAVRRMARALAAIAIHPGWSVCPGWLSAATGSESPGRAGEVLVPVDRLGLLGDGIASAWLRLRNEQSHSDWQETLDLVRLGLGPDLEQVETPADPAGGRVALRLRFRGGRAIPAFSLSDGQLAWLHWIALFRLPAEGGLLVIDEPEAHLHPGLVAYLADLLVRESTRRPVLVCTHSDVFLDAVPDPVSSIVVIDLDSGARARSRRLDAEQLQAWRSEFAGYGSLRAAGLDGTALRDRDA